MHCLSPHRFGAHKSYNSLSAGSKHVKSAGSARTDNCRCGALGYVKRVPVEAVNAKKEVRFGVVLGEVRETTVDVGVCSDLRKT